MAHHPIIRGHRTPRIKAHTPATIPTKKVLAVAQTACAPANPDLRRERPYLRLAAVHTTTPTRCRRMGAKACAANLLRNADDHIRPNANACLPPGAGHPRVANQAANTHQARTLSHLTSHPKLQPPNSPASTTTRHTYGSTSSPGSPQGERARPAPSNNAAVAAAAATSQQQQPT